MQQTVACVTTSHRDMYDPRAITYPCELLRYICYRLETAQCRAAEFNLILGTYKKKKKENAVFGKDIQQFQFTVTVVLRMDIEHIDN